MQDGSYIHMVRINNSDVAKELIESGKLQITAGGLPLDLANSVVPILDVTPKNFRLITKSYGTSSSTTAVAQVLIGSTTTVKDTYICGGMISYAKDATCDNTSMTFDVAGSSPAGATVRLFQLTPLTTTARAETISFTLPIPIKIPAGIAGSSTFTGAFTVGAMTKSFSLWGYEVENVKA